MKKKEYKSHKVLLYPSEIRSQHDGDSHFITADMLKRLFNVLPIDEVRILDKGDYNLPDELLNEKYPGFILLAPLKSGKYHDIHEYDGMHATLSDKHFK